MKNESLRWLYSKTKATHGTITVSVILNILTSLSSVIFAVFMKNLIDSAVSHELKTVANAGIVLVLLTIFTYVTFILSNLKEEQVTIRIMSDMRASMIDSMMHKEYREISKKHSGQWVNLIFSDIRVIAEGTAAILPGVAGMISKLLFAFLLLLYMEPVLALLYLAGGAGLLLGVGLFRGRLKSLHRTVQEKEDSLHSFIQEVMENLLIIKVFRAHSYFNGKAQKIMDDYSEARIRRKRTRLLSVNFFSFVFRMGYLFALLYGAYQLINGKTTYGTLTAILHIVSQIQTPIFNLSGVLPRIFEVIASTDRVREIGKNKEEEPAGQAVDFRMIIADHLKFSYGRSSVIDDADFRINKNDTVALTGISGGGKSTLFLLLLGLYSPVGGNLFLQCGGTMYKPGADTRRLFSYVPQGNGLFTGSIRENVILNNEYDDGKYRAALKTADAYDFVMNLPQKDETRLGERGSGLSEGQNQRIAIARAVYSDAPVLLLDECTSALDEETEARVLNNIKKLQNKTVLIVTHRPAALKICNRHLRIEEHVIIETNDA